MESIVSLERGVCSRAKLQILSCYRGWKEACQATRAILTTWRRELSSSFFFLQGKVPKEIHAILIETLEEHAPSHATIKNRVTQFKRGDFSTCDAPRPGRPKTVTTPEIIDQINELILEDHRISAKSIAEQLGISHEQVGYIIHEDLDMQKLSTKWVPKCLNADQKRQRCQSYEQLLEFFWRDPNDFLSRLPWTKSGCITMTQRQSNNQRSGSIVAHPASKNSECKYPLENFSPRFFRIKTASSSLIIFQSAKLSTPSITHLCWCNWRTVWRKYAVRSSRGSCSCTTMPQLTRHLQPRRNWPTWASNILITHPFLQIWPSQTITCSVDRKNNWKVAIFRPTRRSWLPQWPDWTDNLLNFVWVACKS